MKWIDARSSPRMTAVGGGGGESAVAPPTKDKWNESRVWHDIIMHCALSSLNCISIFSLVWLGKWGSSRGPGSGPGPASFLRAVLLPADARL